MIPHVLSAAKAGPQLPRELLSVHEPDYNDDYPNDDGSDSPVDRNIYHEGLGDTRGYYQDGAYTALPDTQDDQQDADGQEDISEEAAEDARRDKVCRALYGSIIARFEAIRATVRQEPPDDSLLELSSDHGFEVFPFGSSRAGQKSYTTWSWRLRNTNPQPAQIAAMDRTAAFRLLRVVLSDIRMLKRGHEITERTSAWLWSLLAKLPDAGELDYTDVGVVRDLGKRAVLLMASLAHMTALREQVELGQHEGDGQDDDLATGAVDEGEAENCEGGEGMAESAQDTMDPANVDGDEARNEATNVTTETVDPGQSVPGADGDVSEDEPMDLEEGEVDEGEIPDDLAPVDARGGDLEAIKARLLGDLEPPVNLEPELEATEHEDWEATRLRARMNMRMTLNMILTIAGEFYGQRDLLEFRDPFRGM